MAKKLLKSFGSTNTFHAQGYNLLLLASHLEGLIDSEAENMKSFNTPKGKRLAKVEQALELINAAIEIGNEG